MKNKKTIKKLKLSKEVISSFDKKSISGGKGLQPGVDVGLWSFDGCGTIDGNCTAGCTDGCGTKETFQSVWNCTKASCSRNC